MFLLCGLTLFSLSDASASISGSNNSSAINGTNITDQQLAINVANSSSANQTNQSLTANSLTANTTKNSTINQTSQNTNYAAGDIYSNVHAIWIGTGDYNNINVTELKKAYITDVFVKSNIYSNPTYPTVLSSVLSQLNGTGIRVHAWITCFMDANGNWIDPQSSAGQSHETELLNVIQTILANYNIAGIHLDYVRYSGVESNNQAAYQHDETAATNAITSFVKSVHDTVKAVNPNLAVSAAVMPEGSANAYYYGQDYKALAPYLDFMVPMIYKGDYRENSAWIGTTTAYIVSQANGRPVVSGLQTYKNESDTTPLSASELINDTKVAIGNGSSGYALFRYGLIDENFYSKVAPLTVLLVDPANKAVNVAVNKVITVTFSEPIKLGNGYIELKDSNGAAVPFTKSVNGTVLTITPKSALVQGMTYSLIIHTGSVTDLVGNNVSLSVSSFTTVAADKVKPVVSVIDPANKAVNVAVNKVITVTFSEPIKLGNGYIELKDSNGAAVPFTKSVSGNVLTITPKSALVQGMTYSLIIHTGSVTDLVGNNVSLSVSSFTTVAADKVKPVVSVIDPANKAVNVAVNKVITVTFSEPIKLGNGYIELKDSNGAAVPFTKSVSGNVLTITPKSALVQGMTYSLIIHTGSVMDFVGNNVSLSVSSFTTVAADSVKPVVSVIDPANKAVNVAVNKVITVTFSEPIKVGNGYIELKDSNGAAVPFTKSVNGTVLTITPKSALVQGMTYSVIVHTGSVTDLVGNNVSLYGSTFTIVSPVVTTFTSDQILDASARVKAYVEANHGLPNYVTIGSTNVSMAQFLQMMCVDLLQINNGQTTPIPLTNVNSPANPSDNVGSGYIYKAEYLSLAQQLETIASGTAPNYISSSQGNIQFDSAVYMYSRILAYYKNNNALPNYAAIYPWTTITNPNAGLEEYMQATTNCQSDNAQIIALSKSIIANAGATTTYAKAVAIFNWVRDNIGYSYYYNTQYGAVGTLNAKTGNCCDTTHLLMALDRAAGIPARYVHGYCHFSDGWYGHVWAQVYVNGIWYTADAISSRNTFGVVNNWNTGTATIYNTYATLPF